jgi:transposase
MQDRRRQFDEIFLQRTAGPYIGVIRDRRVATRYDKLAASYLAFVKLASIRIWLRAYESTS